MPNELQLTQEQIISILTTSVCVLLEEHRPEQMEVSIKCNTGSVYVVKYDPESKQIVIFECECNNCKSIREN